jgi:hypothetical protein
MGHTHQVVSLRMYLCTAQWPGGVSRRGHVPLGYNDRAGHRLTRQPPLTSRTDLRAGRYETRWPCSWPMEPAALPV